MKRAIRRNEKGPFRALTPHVEDDVGISFVLKEELGECFQHFLVEMKKARLGH